MKEKINIAETLDGCPKGTKLYSPIFGDVYLEKIRPHLAVVVTTESNDKEEFLYDGRYGINGECVLFPSKDQRDWSKFQRPFKDGDIIFTHADCTKIGFGYTWISIFEENRNGGVATYVDYCNEGKDFYTYLDDKSLLCEKKDIIQQRLATEEEKQKLFQAIKDNGYKWNPETKTLEKLPKFKDGDVIANNTRIVIFHKLDKIPNGVRNDVVYYHCWYHKEDNNSKFKIDFGIGYASDFRFATDKEKQILFDVIKTNGYKWNAETKTLEKLVKPRFKVGNRVKSIYNNNQYDIVGLTDTHYTLVEVENKFKYTEPIIEDKNWELVPNKFDITTLKPFDKVLVRDNNAQKWTADLFSFFDKSLICPYSCVGHYTNQCIPYKGNEHLLETTNDCNDFYKTWEE